MKPLRKDEIKELNKRLAELYGIDVLSKKDDVVQEDNLIWVNRSLDFFYLDDKPIPTLRFLLKQDALKKVVVDMGAVKFVTGGADIMRPGIVEIEDGIKKDDAVVILDQNNLKPLAVGTAMFDAEEMRSMSSGKVVKSIHHVGDDVWNSG